MEGQERYGMDKRLPTSKRRGVHAVAIQGGCIMATKKAKRTILIRHKEPTTRTIVKYICPGCKVHFEEHYFDKRITRFKCDQCGQEIIVGEDNGTKN